ncbi:hypothetical protein OSB04_009438 [Centaurea solstitialis]|uniref:C2H2-type domain-containing protein n=1 Tax=Centaurea solstitialis TaxID=347529 RepID=A0AA38WM50_9ASTR|nr:hypothetical protein OSB04_009438 [Centaurea solstitialis]
MNVESFSQLPFIRPSPLKEKGIRLFGKEFGGGGGGSGGDSSAMITDDYESNDAVTAATLEESKETGESNRKFECHYCCRNFPTSQALGGHQNAHKRERQHAKRAHLQSTMVHGSFSEAQMYGFMNYHRFGGSTAAVQPPPYFHHTNTASGITAGYNNRFYGGASSYGTSHHHQTPINGSPLGLWRYPTNAQNSTFNRDLSINPSPLVGSSDGLRASRIPTSASYMYDSTTKPSVQDQSTSGCNQ